MPCKNGNAECADMTDTTHECPVRRPIAKADDQYALTVMEMVAVVDDLRADNAALRAERTTLRQTCEAQRQEIARLTMEQEALRLDLKRAQQLIHGLASAAEKASADILNAA